MTNDKQITELIDELRKRVSNGCVCRFDDTGVRQVSWCSEHAALRDREAALREALAWIAEYTGEGPHTTPWQQIVRTIVTRARTALAAAERAGFEWKVTP